MRASPAGRDELSERVQRVLSLPTNEETEDVVSAVILSLGTTLLTHLETDGFHPQAQPLWQAGSRRKIGFSGDEDAAEDQVHHLGPLRQRERVG